jgi:16S rRNA (guanine966-N2)-methyltransferase
MNLKTAPREVRIIGGQWKRSKLPVPDAPGLRPTPDRVRETLFNWLGQNLEGWRVLDAFAGTGALGFEAASRGAARVEMIERDPRLLRSLQASAQKLQAAQVQARCGDALALMGDMATVASVAAGTSAGSVVPGGSRPLGTARAEFELVLLDPPFAEQLFEAAVLRAVPLLVPGGFLYLEADRAFDAAQAQAWGLQLHRHLRAGAVHAHLLCRPV